MTKNPTPWAVTISVHAAGTFTEVCVPCESEAACVAFVDMQPTPPPTIEYSWGRYDPPSPKRRSLTPRAQQYLDRGREVLLPLIGADNFMAINLASKFAEEPQAVGLDGYEFFELASTQATLRQLVINAFDYIDEA